MQPPPDLSPEDIDEYNANYERAAGLLQDSLQIQGLPRSQDESVPGRLRQALACLARCIDIVPGSYPCLWLSGKAHQALGEHETALAFFERAVSLDAENPDLPREACLEALHLGRAEEAERFAQDACRRNREDAGLLSNLALALTLSKKLEEALAAAQKSIRMAPNDPINKAVLAFVLDVKEGRRPPPDRIKSIL